MATPEAIAAFEASLRHLLANPEVAAEAVALMRRSHQEFMIMIEPDPRRYVRYDALIDRVVYENAHTFYNTRKSPSDSRWMVPGT